MDNALSNLINELKGLIVEALELEDVTAEDIKPTEALFGDGLGLDSIDALELGVAIQKNYGIKFDAKAEDNRQHFSSVQALAEYISAHR